MTSFLWDIISLTTLTQRKALFSNKYARAYLSQSKKKLLRNGFARILSVICLVSEFIIEDFRINCS